MGFLTTRALGVAATVLVAAGFGSRSTAIEFFEGNLEIHGFYEAQVRTIARDYRASDGFDLTQWYNILNIETEADFAPESFPRRMLSEIVPGSCPGGSMTVAAPATGPAARSSPATSVASRTSAARSSPSLSGWGP